MNEASCGSCLTTASASLRMRNQIGSAPSMGFNLCGWAIAVLRRQSGFTTDRRSLPGAPPRTAPALAHSRWGGQNRATQWKPYTRRDARFYSLDALGGLTVAQRETAAPPA